MSEKPIGKVVVYSRYVNDIKDILKQLNEENIDVTLESCEQCLVDLDRCVLDTLHETNPDLIIIDNDATNNGLLLYKMVKDEGTVENIPTLFLGTNNENARLSALKIGAFDYISKPFNREELIIKIKNFIDIGKKYINCSIFDALTGVYIRSYGETTAKNELKAAKEYKKAFSVLAVDLDNMTAINQSIGKAQGDQLIRECVDIFRKDLNARDFIYRHSGQRFIFILDNKDATEAFDFAQLLAEETRKLSEKYNEKISFTAGISSLESKDNALEDLLRKAIKSLENGKLNCKGKVYINESSLLGKRKNSILILDEDKVILGILSSRYRNKGYEVYAAESLEQAVDIIRKSKIDLVLTDYLIPGITGTELIKSLKREKRDLKIMILSAQKNERTIEAALKAGADDYLVKPFSPIELDSRVQRLLE
jgi:diguanylate cyclase (GGDEF)-like protein